MLCIMNIHFSCKQRMCKTSIARWCDREFEQIDHRVIVIVRIKGTYFNATLLFTNTMQGKRNIGKTELWKLYNIWKIISNYKYIFMFSLHIIWHDLFFVFQI